MQFEDKIRKIIEEECEDYFLGIVDLSLAQNPIVEQYSSLFNDYPEPSPLELPNP